MPFQAKMQLEKDDANAIVVLSAEYEFVQPVDAQNHPKGIPKANVLRVIIESSKDNRIIEWMVSPTMTKAVQIIFYGDNGSVIRTIEMKDAYCLGYKETFDHNDSQPFKAIIRLAALNENVKADGKAATEDKTPVTNFVADEPEESKVSDENISNLSKPDAPQAPNIPKPPEVASNTNNFIDLPTLPDVAKQAGHVDQAQQKGVLVNGVLRLCLEPIKAEPPFNPNKKHNLFEFIRQIQAQQEGMNNLSVFEFLENRKAHKLKLASEKAAGKKSPSGRSEESREAQERFRQRIREDVIEGLRDAGWPDAEAMADGFLSSRDALHDPDQIAGGRADESGITSMGDSNVNSSIGAQWTSKKRGQAEKDTRIEKIHAQIEELSKNMTEEEMKKTFLNVHLYP